MPYFLFRISATKKLDLLDQFDKYRDARDQARALRKDPAADPATTIKMVHANSPGEARQLLKEKREAPPSGMNEEF